MVSSKMAIHMAMGSWKLKQEIWLEYLRMDNLLENALKKPKKAFS